MKKRRKTQHRPSPLTAANTQSNNKATVFLFITVSIIVVTAIVLRCFKAVHTGILYDEVFTIFNFGQSFHDALTSYRNPNNNHVINSILINVSRVLFAEHESFYRYHTMLFGAVYCISTAYLIWALMDSYLLRIGFVALLTLHWFVFDLSFLARGYSIALAAIFGGLALLVFLLKRKIAFSSIWLPVGILTAMNFLAFGSMLSVGLLLFVINMSYILIFSHRVFPEGTRPFKPMVIHLLAVPIISGAFLCLLYQFIYKGILAARSDFGRGVSLGPHLKDVLWVNMLDANHLWAQGMYSLFLLLTVAALLYTVYLCLKVRNPARVPFLNLKKPQALIILITIVFFAGMFVYRNIFNMSLGFPRNNVFLIPLFLLSCGIILDSTCALVPDIRVRRVSISVVCVVTLMLTFAVCPSLHAVKVHTWEIQSIAGPLIRDLQTIDPNRRWKIALTKQTWHMNLPLQYYQINGYPVQRAEGNDFDVAVTHQSENIPGASFYREDFYDSFECRIVFNPVLIQRYSLNEKIGQ